MKYAPERPPVAAEAFLNTDDASVQAQAGILLGIGAELRGDRQKMQARSAAVAQPTDMMLAEDLEEFPIPRLPPAAKRYAYEDLEGQGRVRFSVLMREAAGEPEALAKMADDVYTSRSMKSAAILAHAALRSPHPLVRVAAAHAALPVTTDPVPAVMTLAEHTHDSDDLVREVAATALARYMPEHPKLQDLVGSGDAPALQLPSDTSMLIHGTFARNFAWHQPPQGDFWQYIQGKIWPDLYGKTDFFRWSGGYSDGARALAGDQLVKWIVDRNEQGISLMPHSHGCIVTMLASWRGVMFDRLVFLSSPVHPSKYSVNFGNVGKVVSVRVRFDLVLLADGSGSRFNDSRYNEHVLPIWFNHSATHYPDVWEKYDIPSML